MLQAMKAVMDYVPPPFRDPPLKFDPSREAANHNFRVLSEYNFNIEALINAHPNTPMSYGSEFRPIEVLSQLLGHHPNWDKLSLILTKGVHFNLREIDEKDRLGDLQDALTFGNHKSAAGEWERVLETELLKDVEQGWLVPLLPEHVGKIPGAMMSPMGINHQPTINGNGTTIIKERPTHDLSWEGDRSQQSVNSLVQREKLEPCMIGHMCLRLIHYIIGCRARHPSSKIYISKVDFKSAYRRLHIDADTIAKHFIHLKRETDDLVACSLRLTFGGAPNATEFGKLSETTADLCNDILRCEAWNPSILTASFQHQIPPPKSLPESTPYAQSLPTIVDIPNDDYGKADIYIDDLTTVTVDIGANVTRAHHAPALAVDLLTRPQSTNEPLPRSPMVAANKCEAESALEEVKLITGWIFNTRTLTIELPSNKRIAWSNSIKSIIKQQRVDQSELQSLIGRLNHAATLIPMARHFMGRLYSIEQQSKKYGKTYIPNAAIKDLQLWLIFLEKANKGINMNLLTFRRPTNVYRSDACEHGLGGYSATGVAWRWKIPPHLLGRAHINVLEFLGQLVGIWWDILLGNLQPLDCVLAMGDSTTAIGWMHRSNFTDDNEGEGQADRVAKMTIARKTAELVITNDLKLYSQWFRGCDNDVADCLSRDLHVDADTLSLSIPHLFPSQVPPNFKISPLPQEIVSFTSAVLQAMPVQTARSKRHKTTGKDHSSTGHPSVTPLGSNMTHSWTISATGNGTSCSQASPQLSDPGSLPGNLAIPWLKAQSKIPSAMWHRPSGQTTGQTPDWMATARLAVSSKSYTERTKTKTPTQNNRKPFQPSSSKR